MKSSSLRLASLLAACALSPSLAPAALLMHWKLDEAGGDYTGGGYAEEVSSSVLSSEVATGADVTEGRPGLAPGGGTSVEFFDGPSDTYISAGSLESDGTHVAGPAADPYVLGANFTISGWFRTDTLSSEHIFVSNRFGSTTGWMMGTRNGGMVMDFGNQRSSFTPTIPLVVGQDYLFVVRQDPDGDTNLGWSADSNHRLSLYDVTNDTWQHFDGTQNRPSLNLTEISIGRFTNGGREWDGLVDDIRIYDHTLSDAELNALVEIPEPGAPALAAFALLLIGIRRRR